MGVTRPLLLGPFYYIQTNFSILFCTRLYMILCLPDWSHDARFFSRLSICKNLPFVTQCIIERIILYNTSLSDHIEREQKKVSDKKKHVQIADMSRI